MKEKTPPVAEEPAPTPGMTGTFWACLQAVLREATVQRQVLQEIACTWLGRGYRVSSAKALSVFKFSRALLWRVVVFYVLLLVTVALLVAVLSGCLITSVTAAAAARHVILANVPGTSTVPLHFNALPFHSDDWRRHIPADEILRDFVLPDRETHSLQPSFDQQGRAVAVPQRQFASFTDAKFSLLGHYVNSHLASTTMYIPRATPSAEIFSPKGGVNLESLFQLGPAMFNAKGEYTGKLQVVLAKEEVGRDVPLILESSVLFSEDAMAVQSISQFDVLFKSSTSVAVRTGPERRAWGVVAALKLLRLCFYLPVRSYEYLLNMVSQKDNAAFPPIDDSREVATVLQVYTRFTPPLALQPRLRAMNFSLYQLPNMEAPSRVTVSRLVFLSTVQLTGAARWLTDYPISTFLLVVAMFFAVTSCISLGGLLVLLIYIYALLPRSPTSATAAELEKEDEDSQFFSTPHDIPLPVVRSLSAPLLRPHPGHSDAYDALDISQLRRSGSFVESSPRLRRRREG